MPPDPHPLAVALPEWRWFHDMTHATIVVVHPSGLWTEFGDATLGRCWFRTGELAPDEGEPELWAAIAAALRDVVGVFAGQALVETSWVEGDVLIVEATAVPFSPHARTFGLFPTKIFDGDTGLDLYVLDVDGFAGGGHSEDQGDGLPAELTVSKTVDGETEKRALYRRVAE